MSEKASAYLILSDRTYIDPSGEHVRIAYATRTASTLALDIHSAELLERGDAEGLLPDVVRELREVEAIVPAHEAELATILDRSRRAVADRGSLKFTLLPTAYCNMGCAYCGQTHSRGSLPRGHRDAVRARVLAAMRRPTTRRCHVGWFGGEPMAGFPTIRDLSKSFVIAADDGGIDYMAYTTTNGTLLTLERLRVLLHDCRLKHIEITLDGPPEVHDQHRPLKGGGTSFESIVAIVEAALVEPDLEELSFGFRTNVDVHNRDHVSDYIQLMGDRGSLADDRVSFSLHPVHPWGNDVSAIELAKRDYAKREAEWLKELTAFDLRIQALPSIPKPVVCSAVSQNAEVISSTGRVFSCTEHPLVAEMEIDQASLGRLDDPSFPEIRPLGPFDDWHDAIERGDQTCQQCVFLPVCGGGCPKHWREGHWPCPSYKFNTQARFDITAELNGLHPVA